MHQANGQWQAVAAGRSVASLSRSVISLRANAKSFGLHSTSLDFAKQTYIYRYCQLISPSSDCQMSKSASILNKLVNIHLATSVKCPVSQTLAKRIEADLKSAHFQVSQINKLNEAPKAFTVIITDRTLEDGVLKLQHIFPNLAEEVHVSDLRDRLREASASRQSD